MSKKCVLYDRDCVSCGECDLCDLTPGKICDNCGKCIEVVRDYETISIAGILRPKTGKGSYKK